MEQGIKVTPVKYANNICIHNSPPLTCNFIDSIPAIGVRHGKKYRLLHSAVIVYRNCTEPIWQGAICPSTHLPARWVLYNP